MHARLRRAITAAAALALVAVGLPATTATAAPYYPPDDYCLGQCADLLPPGQNGNATLVDILGNQTLGTYPAHSKDQLGRYADLISGYTGLTDEQISAFFGDSGFGVPANQVESTVSPRSDVTIVRDKATGVPHVTGTTREGTMFGAGYAGAQDRLWVMDLMRHVGRGELTPFAGGAAGNRELEQSVWRNSPTRRPTSRPRSTGCGPPAAAAPSSTPTCRTTSPGSTPTSTAACPPATARASTSSPATSTRSRTREARGTSR